MKTPVEIPLEAHLRRRYPTALTLLDFWEMPWSVKRARYALWALTRVALRLQVLVIETEESMEALENVSVH